MFRGLRKAPLKPNSREFRKYFVYCFIACSFCGLLSIRTKWNLLQVFENEANLAILVIIDLVSLKFFFRFLRNRVS